MTHYARRDTKVVGFHVDWTNAQLHSKYVRNIGEITSCVYRRALSLITHSQQTLY